MTTANSRLTKSRVFRTVVLTSLTADPCIGPSLAAGDLDLFNCPMSVSRVDCSCHLTKLTFIRIFDGYFVSQNIY